MQFNIYTYQFKPIYQEPNLFFDLDLKAKEAMQKKNIIFAEALANTFFEYRKKKHSVQFLNNANDLFIFKISNPKKIKIEKSFKISEDINEPSAYVIICNDKEIQRIAIQQNLLAFTDTDVIAKIISNSVRANLKKSFLQITIRREYSRNEFWNIIRENINMVMGVTFHFDYPNLPRLRSLIPEMLKEASTKTRSSKTTLAFEAEKGEILHIDEDNQDIQALNNGAADCGAQVSIKIKGQKRIIKTGNTTKELNFDEVTITGSPDILKDVLRNINE